MDELMQAHPISERRACRVVNLSRHLRVYQPKRVSEQVIMDEMSQLVADHPSWGCGKLHHAFRRAGRRWNHKRVYRLYHQMGLHHHPKLKKRLPRRHPQPLSPSPAPNECWSIDFMRDALSNGRKFRTFNVVDNFNRQALAPGCPYQNAYIERFNRTFREDVLDATWFDSLDEAQCLADQWRHLYNEHRPHDALGGLTPLDFLAQASPPSLLFIGSI